MMKSSIYRVREKMSKERRKAFRPIVSGHHNILRATIECEEGKETKVESDLGMRFEGRVSATR
jgi:hypothetical protein